LSNVQADRSRRAGFTLIEVLVALAIAALGLGMMMMAAGTGLGNATLADQTIEATRRAQAHLATLGTLTPLRPGETSGQDDGGYFWRVRISEPAMHTAAATPAGMPLGLYTVDVTIIWRAGVSTKSVSLSSQRFGRVADGNG
jgi:general secretion pathway protein I